TDGARFYRFGDLECRFQDGASRLSDGSLAGGGHLLTDSFCSWIERESLRKNIASEKLLKQHLKRIHEFPIRAISGSKTLLSRFPDVYEISSRGPTKGRISVLPIQKRK